MRNPTGPRVLPGVGREPVRRLLRALGLPVSWLGWWVATGLLVMTAFVVGWKVAHGLSLSPRAISWSVGLGAAGIVIVALLWRWRRDSDTAIAAAVLTAGFWLALLVLLWPQL